MGLDIATCRDKGKEVPSLSRDKGTTGQAQNLGFRTGWVGTACQNPERDVTRDVTGQDNHYFSVKFIKYCRIIELLQALLL